TGADRHAGLGASVDLHGAAPARSAGVDLSMARSGVALKDHWKEQRLFFSRVIGAAVIVVLLTGLVISRLVQLQIVDYQRFSALSQNNRVRIEPLAPPRGLIFDRNGMVLADNVPTWELVAVPE